MDNEKKFKLDELPDEGGHPVQENKASSPKRPLKDKEPRLEKLKNMTASERVNAMTQRWHFDNPVRKWDWIIPLVILVVLQKGSFYSNYLADRMSIEARTDGMSEIFFGVIPLIDPLARYPLIFALLIPLLFKFKVPSDIFFEITFDGINTVRTLTPKKNEVPTRIFIKWGEITEVKKITHNKRDILQLYTVDGPLAQMIWNIEDTKKQVLKQILKGLVSSKNAFRIFIEKEVT